MSHRHFGRSRSRPHRKQGFSRPVSRQWFQMLGIRREHKRGFFNMLAKNVVGAFAITAGTLGLVEWGWVGGIVLGIAGGVFGVWFVMQDRMFR